MMVNRSKLETVKAILTSEYWLIVSLCGAFFAFFALNRGGAVIFIHACFVFLILNFVFKEYRIGHVPVSFWVTLAVFAYLLGASVLFHPKLSHYRWMTYPVRMLGIVFAIHCLSIKNFKNWFVILFCAVLTAAVCWQLIAFHIFKMKWGTFSNPHYIASFSMLALPAIVYFLWVAKGWYKLIFIPIAVLDFDLVLEIGSRPAIAAITIATLFALFFLVHDRRKWLGVLSIGVFFVVLYATGYLGLADRLEDLIVNLPREDRVQIWTATWTLLKDNSLLAWIVGNGIGTFRLIWPQYAPPDEINEVFPHGFFLEVLYASGLVGLIVFVGATILLFVYSIRALKKIADRKIGLFVRIMLVELIAWMIHCGLTFPIYSKYSQYSLAFILGPLLAVLANKSLTLSESDFK